MTMEWMFEPEEYVPDYSAHVRAARATRHDEHVKIYKDILIDIALAKIGARRVRPSLMRADEVGIQPMSGPIPLSLSSSLRSLVYDDLPHAQ